MPRKTYYVAQEFPEMNHANGRKTIGELNPSLDYNKERYPECYRWWKDTLGQSDANFLKMTVASAVLNQCHWAGNGSGFGPGVSSTSRNNVEQIPGGEYLVNVGITVLQGRFIGGGTSIGLGGNAATQLIYDHDRWMDPRPIRAVIISGNWGTYQYLESCYISDVRVTGNAPHWLDTSYTQHGIALRMFGETAVLDRVYVETCNGHGVWINGAGPGKVVHLTTFDNNLAGLYVSNATDGSVNGNSLGKLQVDHVSGDNNAWVVLNRSGGSMLIGYLKNEDGLSAQRGRPKKDQVSYEGHGWINTVILSIDDAVKGASGPTVVLNSTANKSMFTVMHYASVAANNSPNEGRSALIADVRAKKAWRAAKQDEQDLRVMKIEWTGFGTMSSLVCSEPMVEIPFNGTTRLGIASSYAGYDYAAATPVWDPTGGTAPPPPPPPPTCTWVLGTPGPWGACVNGQETRTTPYVSSVAGCTPSTPKPSDVVETRACTVTPPPPTGSGIDPNDVLVVTNSADSRTAAWGAAYAAAWGIPAGNVIAVNGGTSHDANTTTAAAMRTAIEAKGKQYTVLAMEYPSRVGSQSITSYITFGSRDVSKLTVSPLFGYTGFKPRTDKGAAPSWLLVSDKYIRKDAHATNPTGQAIMVLAKDQSGTPRGSARAGQTASGVTVWDNRTYSGIGNGNNACNYISTLCWRNDRKPGSTPIVAAYQSMYQLGDAGTTVWAKGFFGDHVTSFGGFLPAGSNGLNGQNQTPLTYHLDRGASFSVGSVSEPWQGSGGSLAQQFVNVSLFHPRFTSGLPVGVAAWSAVQCPDRALMAGDGLCAPFGK